MKNGAQYLGKETCAFSVWAPKVKNLTLRILSHPERTVSLKKDRDGYWGAVVPECPPGTKYFYFSSKFSGRPDPSSFSQPTGVHGPSEIVDHQSFSWSDKEWEGIKLNEMIIYELHVGTFTKEGSFSAAIAKLDDLKELGVTAIEIMPVAQFPGERNWGYDGAYPFAVQNSYGGVDGLKSFVNACHLKGIAVVLDVVYNHIGPEGNYFDLFGPYFVRKYKTPWGRAMNFDQAKSEGVREFFIENALYWFREFRVDALRLDAIDAIIDMSAHPFLKELCQRVQEFSKSKERELYLIAESDLNDVKVINPKSQGGYGFHCQWCDDFHHALHALLTKETNGYYNDYGTCEHFKKALTSSFVYSGEYSQFRGHHYGNSAAGNSLEQFIVYTQNHDQIGNRLKGERLSRLVSFEALKLAAGVTILSPYIPMLFMGEEYGEDKPFYYFVDHSDENIIRSVRRGRKREYRLFSWGGKPRDPQDSNTFLASKLCWEKKGAGKNKTLFNFYKDLIKIRKTNNVFKCNDRGGINVQSPQDRFFIFRKTCRNDKVLILINFSNENAITFEHVSNETWHKAIDSADELFNGPGSLLPDKIKRTKELVVRPMSIAMYELD